MAKLIYPELSYKLVGLAFKVYNDLGSGYQEKYYKRAFELELQRENITYKKEKEVPLIYDGESIGKYFLDFIIEDKLVLEFKVGNFFHSRDIKQILGYLKSTNSRLGILIICKKDKLAYKRIVNDQYSYD